MRVSSLSRPSRSWLSGSGTVPDQPFEAVAVPVRDRHRPVHRPAARVVGSIEGVDRRAVQVAVPVQPPQAPTAHLRLHRPEVRNIKVNGRVEDRTAITIGAEHPVGHQDVEMDMAVEITDKPSMNCANSDPHDGSVQLSQHHGPRPPVARCCLELRGLVTPVIVIAMLRLVLMFPASEFRLFVYFQF